MRVETGFGGVTQLLAQPGLVVLARTRGVAREVGEDGERLRSLDAALTRRGEEGDAVVVSFGGDRARVFGGETDAARASVGVDATHPVTVRLGHLSNVKKFHGRNLTVLLFRLGGCAAAGEHDESPHAPGLGAWGLLPVASLGVVFSATPR